jgi:hypothetical protein
MALQPVTAYSWLHSGAEQRVVQEDLAQDIGQED